MLAGKKLIALIAMDQQRGIWYQWKIPWDISEDLQYFRDCITDKTIVMGRKTYESIYTIYQSQYPHIYGHPKARRNIIVSHTAIPDALVAHTIDQVIDLCDDDQLRIIGGSQIFSLFSDYIDTILMTHIQGFYPADTFFPLFEDQFDLVEDRIWSDARCRFCIYQRST